MFLDQATAFNAGQNTADLLLTLGGGVETIAGGTGAGGGALATVTTLGLGSPVSVPVTAGGVGMMAHGSAMSVYAGHNLLDQNGRLNATGSRRFSREDRAAGFEKSKDAQGTPRCEYCGRELDSRSGKSNSYEADHRTSYKKGGESTQDNLAPSCRSCNRSKGSKNADEWDPYHEK